MSQAAFSINFPRLFSPVHFLGVGLAMGLSWVQNHSILWVIFHSFTSWLYIGYRVAPKVSVFLGG